MWLCWCVGLCDTVIISCLKAHFYCIVQHSLYHNWDIGTMWHCALVSCIHHSLYIGLVLGCAISQVECHYVLLSLFPWSNFILIFIMILVTILNYNLRLTVTKWFWFWKCASPWMIPPLDILNEYLIEYVTFGLLYVMFIFPTKIFYREFQGFATDCPCGVGAAD